MPYALCYLNNRFLPYHEAKIRVSDIGLHRGFSIFEYFLEMDNRMPFFDDYLDRFYASAGKLALEVPLSRDLLKEKIFYLLQQNKFGISGIRLLLTGGYSEDMFTPSTPNFMILNLPMKNHPSVYKKGIKLLQLDYQRYLPEVKSTFYLPSIALLPEMKKRGALEVLYHHEGWISETTRSNIFLIKNGKLLTPSSGILKGITRKHVLDLAKEILPVEERKIKLQELWECDEAFITGTSKHVAPVLEVDGKLIGDGKPGKVSLQIWEAFEEQYNIS
jgi:D-alanine transaminase/branched-chain amino acid aminotransferase